MVEWYVVVKRHYSKDNVIFSDYGLKKDNSSRISLLMSLCTSTHRKGYVVSIPRDMYGAPQAIVGVWAISQGICCKHSVTQQHFLQNKSDNVGRWVCSNRINHFKCWSIHYDN